MHLVLALLLAVADGEQDNKPDNVRSIPPPGVAVPEADRADLTASLETLTKEIETLRGELKGKPALCDRLPDVEIYAKAVRYALSYNEFYDVKEVASARSQLAKGMERVKSLREGTAPWTSTPGLLALGYVSKIDGSVQPYGLVIPPSWQPGGATKHRLDTWFHGRSEKLTELSFIDGRQKSAGEFTPKDAFVLHLYGRYCCANKMAGEIDLLEALEDVRKRYAIDENRIVVRGFSMGGAACWQFAVHYTDRWCAAAPGAGFSETPDFLKVFQNEQVTPTPWEQTLWHWYDCTDWAANLFNLPTVAYSGEIDKQKQAADQMEAAMKKEGLELVHLIGLKTAHKYEPAAKEELNRRIDAHAERGRIPLPPRVKLVTWTLRYPRMFWVRVDALDAHWSRGRINAEIHDGAVVVHDVAGIRAFSLCLPAGQSLLPKAGPVRIRVGEKVLDGTPVSADGAWTAHLRHVQGAWTIVPAHVEGGLRKVSGLQGPIDDAFMDAFLMVTPTGTPLNEKVGAWAAKEREHAVTHWRSQFRGDARVTTDDKLTDAEIAGHNLVLWGDPQSNKVLARIADKLPLRWDAKEVKVGARTFPADTHVPVFVFPNPLNPKRYVVVNSGFTFREYDYLNNARQVAKLPDWAVLDVSTPPSSRYPGKVVTADFFDEEWKLK